MFHKHIVNIQKYHMVVMNFPDFGCHLILKLLNGTTLFHSHIIKQLKSYGMVVKSWKSIEGTKTNHILCKALL